MRTWTFLAEHINKNNMTYYIQNWGWNEEEIYKNLKLDEDQKKIFKRTYFNGFEKDIQENEFKVLMQEVIKNLNVVGVYEISNHYNRDQATINQMKDNRRLIWESKGYTEINHCEPLEIDTEGGKTIINLRDYLYILNEKITNKEKEYDELNKNLNKYEEEIEKKKLLLDKELKEYKKDIKDEKYHALFEATRQLEIKKEKLEEEYLITEEEIEQNKERIKKQNWFIKQKQDIKKEYDEFCKKQGEALDKLAAFQTIYEVKTKEVWGGWRAWPEELKSPSSKGIKEFVKRHKKMKTQIIDSIIVI